MNPIEPAAVLRLLDANANRAREALRVLEDYTRFTLNHSQLSAQLKYLRHDFAAATQSWQAVAILHRDTPGDVGTANKTAAELQRPNIDAVVIAAGKRLGEALRSIEEFTKTFDPVAAAAVEKIRYRFYELERIISLTLRAADRFAAVHLCVLITESFCRHPWLEVAEQAIAGGADCLQLREKNLESAQLLSRAIQLTELCHLHGVLCIINDRADIAQLSGADGVHLGQTDLHAGKIRRIVGNQMIVGVSTHNIEQARQAVADGADYIGVGPVFASATKPRDFLPGLPFAAAVAAEIKIPALAIAGITLANVDDVLGTGMMRIAVTAAVAGAADVKSAAHQFKIKLTRRRKSGM